MKTKIIWEDHDIIVCRKPAGIAVQTSRLGQPDMVSELKNYRKQKENRSDPYIGVVHRLDQPVEGLVVFARNKAAAAFLSAQAADGRMEKKYFAVVRGRLKEPEGTVTDYLLKDAVSNLSRVVSPGTKGAKRAELSYRVLSVIDKGSLADREREAYSLVEITLKTGRHHQIRVQMAHMGNPLAGDSKYGEADGEIRNPALCAYRLSFLHPADRKEREYKVVPQAGIFHAFEMTQKDEFVYE